MLANLWLFVMLSFVAGCAVASSVTIHFCSGKLSWTFPHDIAEWEGLGAKIEPKALRDMDGTSFDVYSRVTSF